MTATDELRKLLDERGVEWKDHHYDNHTWWSDDNNIGWHAENRPAVTCLYVKIEAVLTPEQAIAATLGRGACQQEERGWSTEGDHARVWLTCGHDCMVETVADLPNYCPNCGAKVVDA